MIKFYSLITILLLFSLSMEAQILKNSDLSKITSDQIPDSLKTKLNNLKTNNSSQNAPINTERSVTPDTYKTFVKASSNIFGASLFTTPSLSFEPNLRIATPQNYIIGPDDELLIIVTGYQEASLKVIVQPEGSIYIPQVGSLNISGLTFNEAVNRIKSKMAATAYATIKSGQTQVSVTLGKIRSIHITAIGAAKPGNYTVSSLTTVFNSLFLCGGPGDINSYREIELIRNNKVYQKVDLYRFLTRGDQSGNVILQENDVINFPVYQKRVDIKGEVKRPGIFELKTTESLKDLLFYAGDFSKNAYKANIKVKQFTDTERRIKDLGKQDFETYIPNNGDEFQVNALLERIDNAVSINGGVYRPGQFELTPDLTLKGLIEKAGGLLEGVFNDRGLLTRIKEDKTKEIIPFNVRAVMNGNENYPLVKGDEVQIATLEQFRENYQVSIEGEVRKPGTYPYTEHLTLKDLFFQAGGLTDAGSTFHVEIGRRLVSENAEKPTDTIAKVFDIQTEREIAQMTEGILLMPNDIVRVRKNPSYVLQKTVQIMGEVNFPGSYTLLSKNERISDLVNRAGGLTKLANRNGVFLIRNNLTSEIVKKDKLTKVEAVQSGIRDSSSTALEAVVSPTSKIAIDLEKIINDPGSNENYTLLEGDYIEVSLFDPLVKISGEVLMPTKTNFDKPKSVNYYLRKSGGVTENGRKAKIFVIYANGDVDKTNNGLFGLFRTYPNIAAGTEIIVPGKAEKRKFNTAVTVGLTSALVSLVTLVIITINSLK